MFWLSYESFSLLCDTSLLKRVISSHSSGEVERGLKRLHLGQVKTTLMLNKKGICTGGDYLQRMRRIKPEFERVLYYCYY